MLCKLAHACVDEHSRPSDEKSNYHLLQEWMEQRQSDKESFGEEKLVQGPDQSQSLPSVLLHALQRIIVAGLVRVLILQSKSMCHSLCSSTPAEAVGCYLVQKALQSLLGSKAQSLSGFS